MRSVSLGQQQSFSAQWPLDNLSTKFCWQFSLRSASCPYFRYPDGPGLITVAHHTQHNFNLKVNLKIRQNLFSSFAAQQHLIRVFLQTHAVFGLFASKSRLHLAMADALLDHFYRHFFIFYKQVICTYPAHQSAIVWVCACMCDVLLRKSGPPCEPRTQDGLF